MRLSSFQWWNLSDLYDTKRYAHGVHAVQTIKSFDILYTDFSRFNYLIKQGNGVQQTATW